MSICDDDRTGRFRSTTGLTRDRALMAMCRQVSPLASTAEMRAFLSSSSSTISECRFLTARNRAVSPSWRPQVTRGHKWGTRGYTMLSDIRQGHTRGHSKSCEVRQGHTRGHLRSYNVRQGHTPGHRSERSRKVTQGYTSSRRVREVTSGHINHSDKESSIKKTEQDVRAGLRLIYFLMAKRAQWQCNLETCLVIIPMGKSHRSHSSDSANPRRIASQGTHR